MTRKCGRNHRSFVFFFSSLLLALILGLTYLSGAPFVWSRSDRGKQETVQSPSPLKIGARDLASTRQKRASLDDGLSRDATAALRFSRAEILLDNDLSFQRKIEAVRAARRGSSIKLIYYIYHDDQSSAYLSKELIAAAQRGAKVQILLDYFYNYRHLDMFSMMEASASQNNLDGSLSVRFYNRPTPNQIKDIVYATTPCPEPMNFKGCAAEKDKIVNRLFKKEKDFSSFNNGSSGLFFSGWYEKDPRLMATAILEGQKIDLEKLKNSGGAAMTPEEKKSLKDLLETYWVSKTGSPVEKLGADLKLAVAKFFFGAQVSPIFDAIEAMVPSAMKREKHSLKDWEFWTDFTHHKLLLVDDKYLVLGGRNIENSYSMNPNPMLEKYLFWDTDLFGVLKAGGQQIRSSFNDLYNFRQMVATLEEVRTTAPNDLAANNRIISQRCTVLAEAKEIPADDTMIGGPESDLATQPAAKKALIADCIKIEAKKDPLNLTQRMALRKKQMEERAAEFEKKVVRREAGQSIFKSGERFHPDLPTYISISSTELAQAYSHYVENLPYSKDISVAQRTRNLGTTDAKYKKNSKHIHAQWIEGYRRTCELSALDGKERSIIHYNAYFFPPSVILNAWKDLFIGKIDCGKITLKVITNSQASTDLAVINGFAAHLLTAFFQYYNVNKHPTRGIKIEIYETNGIASTAHISLHSKVTLFGDDIMIGSANADIRSYQMDTNNAVLFRNVPEAATKYRKYFDQLTDPENNKAKRVDQIFRVISNDDIHRQNRIAFDKFLEKYNVRKHLSVEQIQLVHDFWDELLYKAYRKTMDTLNKERGAGDEFNALFKVI